ncbi:hypothetical protein IWQ52_001423 [Labrenzia sp. EL_159]|nr:hypothetical protein [Labrenzia sp. EL_162]MBG6193909.1 hypothetical protein [Labrenzia sp. EL_159]
MALVMFVHFLAGDHRAMIAFSPEPEDTPLPGFNPDRPTALKMPVLAQIRLTHRFGHAAKSFFEPFSIA